MYKYFIQVVNDHPNKIRDFLEWMDEKHPDISIKYYVDSQDGSGWEKWHIVLNDHGRNNVIEYSKIRATFGFKNQQDAMLCKLMWM